MYNEVLQNNELYKKGAFCTDFPLRQRFFKQDLLQTYNKMDSGEAHWNRCSVRGNRRSGDMLCHMYRY